MSAMDLVEFLLARIAEDEASALLAASGGGWHQEHLPDWTAGGNGPDDRGRYWPTTIENGKWRVAGGHGGEDDGVAENYAQHIARWDPARVLAECEAKRRIVEGCADLRRKLDHYGVPTDFDDEDILSLLALPYADHPDYREDWRP